MVKRQTKSGAADAKSLKDCGEENKNAAISRSKRPQHQHTLVLEKVSSRKRVSGKEESPKSVLPKSRLVQIQSNVTSSAKKATRGRKKETAEKCPVQSKICQNKPKQAAESQSSASVTAAMTRHKAKKALNRKTSNKSLDSIPSRIGKEKMTKNPIEKVIKTGTKERTNSASPNITIKSQCNTASASTTDASSPMGPSKTNDTKNLSKTPVRASMLRRTRRATLPFDSDPASVRKTRSKITPKSRNAIKKKDSACKTSVLSHSLRSKMSTGKFPILTTPVKKKERIINTPGLSTTGDEISQTAELDQPEINSEIAEISNTSTEKLHGPKKLKTNQLKSAVSITLTQLNVNTSNANTDSSLHAETLLSGSRNLSFLNVTKSPIIRTRKVNPKYADCVIPPQFSFVKQAVMKSVKTPISQHSPYNLAVSSPVPIVLIKDVTGLNKGNLEDTEESNSDLSELSVSEVPVVGLDSQDKNIMVSKDLNSNVSESNKAQTSVGRGHRSASRISNRKPKTFASEANSVVNQKTITKVKNTAKVNTKTVNPISKEKMHPTSASSAGLVSKSSKIVKENTDNSVTNATETASCVVKLSECPIKLAVFRSPSQGATSISASSPDESCDELSESQPEQQALLSSMEPPRPSKRELLALALKEGKLDKIANPRSIKKPNVKLSVPVLVKSTKKAANKLNLSCVEVNACTTSSSLDTTKLVGANKVSVTTSKKPVWAHAMSPSKKVKRLSSTRIKPPTNDKANVSRAIFDFSFGSEDDKAQNKTQKVRKKAKVIKVKTKVIKEKPRSTKTKILTTDLNFEKEFPTTWDSRQGKSKKPVADVPNQMYPDDSFHVDFDIHDDHFDNLEPDIRPTGSTELFNNVNSEEVRDLSSGITEVISGNDVLEVQGTDEVLSHGSHVQVNPIQSGCNARSYSIASSNEHNDCEDLSRTPLHRNGDGNNTGKNLGSGNTALPTPDATRLMSKLVGGTSTPFPASNSCPIVSSKGSNVPIAFSTTTNRAETQPEPISVSEQIKTCFGFDESDDDVDDRCELTSFNLSPVRRENSSFCPFSHQYSVVSDAGNGSVRGLPVSRNNSNLNNTSHGAFLRPTTSLTNRTLARPSGTDRASQGGSCSQGTFRILTKTVPIMAGSSQLHQCSDLSGKQSVKITSRSNHATVNPQEHQSSAASTIVSAAENAGTSNTEATGAHESLNGSVTEEKSNSCSGTNDGKKSECVQSNAAAGSPCKANGVLEESRLFDDVDTSPAKLCTSSNTTQVEVHRAADAEAHIISPEKSFSEPVRHSYDRRSLQLSRSCLLETLAGGPPLEEDDEAHEADQEDVSSTGVLRRRKRRPAMVPSVVKSALQRSRGRPATQPTIIEAFKRSTAPSEHAGEHDSSIEEAPAGNQRRTRKRVVRPKAATGSGAGTKRGRKDTAEGNNNKKAKSQHPEQPEFILLQAYKANKATKSVAFDESSELSNASNTSSNSSAVKKSQRSKKPSKAAAFQKSVDNWASDINSHFSEIEDLELVVMDDGELHATILGCVHGRGVEGLPISGSSRRETRNSSYSWLGFEPAVCLPEAET
ncbi:hypothetical protein FHG87_014927 [Trinorchestia longiramus]|nr:hypothetical protein FHG87_014927 [Trinorchestia longiramus]